MRKMKFYKAYVRSGHMGNGRYVNNSRVIYAKDAYDAFQKAKRLPTTKYVEGIKELENLDELFDCLLSELKNPYLCNDEKKNYRFPVGTIKILLMTVSSSFEVQYDQIKHVEKPKNVEPVLANIRKDSVINRMIQEFKFIPLEFLPVEKFVRACFFGEIKDRKPFLVGESSFSPTTSWEVLYTQIFDSLSKKEQKLLQAVGIVLRIGKQPSNKLTEEQKRALEKAKKIIDFFDDDNEISQKEKEVGAKIRGKITAILEEQRGSKNGSGVIETIRKLLERYQSHGAYERWKRLLYNAFTTVITQDSKKYTNKRLNKRYEIGPGTKYEMKSSILVLIDSSGSVTENMIAKFVSEIESITRFYKTKFEVAYYSEGLGKVRKLSEWKKEPSPDVTGGTNLEKALKALGRKRYDVTLVLTDGYDNVPNKKLFKSHKIVFGFLEGLYNEQFKEEVKKFADVVIIPLECFY